jgi:hypothetical protein
MSAADDSSSESSPYAEYNEDENREADKQFGDSHGDEAECGCRSADSAAHSPG